MVVWYLTRLKTGTAASNSTAGEVHIEMELLQKILKKIAVRSSGEEEPGLAHYAEL